LTVYSPSRLSAYENCPRKFEFRYIRKIKSDTEGVEAYLGKRVHELLERLYHHVARHRRPPSLRQVLDRYRSDWQLRWHDEIEIVRKENDAEHYLRIGVRCLENYYRSHYPFDDGETVAIEAAVRLQLDDDGRYKMRGIIDRLVRRAPGQYEIHDYKTGAWLPPQKQLDSDRQLATYQIGIEQSYPDAESVELVWHYLAHDRTLRSSRSPEQLAGLRGETMELIDRIEAATEFPPVPGNLCRWCEYRSLCPEAELPGEASGEGAQPEEPPLPGRPLGASAGPRVGGIAATAPPGGGDAETLDPGTQLSLL
jgi:putative RecB family exonuclease